MQLLIDSLFLYHHLLRTRRVLHSRTRIYEHSLQQDVSATSSWPFFLLSSNIPEIPERGGPCWLLKLRQMGYKWKVSWFIHWLVVPVQEIFTMRRACSSQPSTKMFFFPPHTFSLYVFPSPSNLGRQSCRVACLLICVFGAYNTSEISPQSSDLQYLGDVNQRTNSLKFCINFLTSPCTSSNPPLFLLSKNHKYTGMNIDQVAVFSNGKCSGALF